MMRPSTETLLRYLAGLVFACLQWPLMWLLLRSSHLGVSDQQQLFASAGYSNAEVFEESEKGWICALGTKPAHDR